MNFCFAKMDDFYIIKPNFEILLINIIISNKFLICFFEVSLINIISIVIIIKKI